MTFMIEPSPCVLSFPIYFLSIDTEAKFEILQWNPYFDYWRRKDIIAFSAMKSV